MEIVKCAQCGKEEEYDMKPGYPRKYCVACSAIRKAEYANKQSMPITESVKPEEQQIDARNNLMDARTESIVAQVILKEASAMTQVVMDCEWSKAAIGEHMCGCVDELTGAFKLALSNVQAL